MRCGNRRKFGADRSETKLSKNRQSMTSVYWRVGLKGLMTPSCTATHFFIAIQSGLSYILNIYSNFILNFKSHWHFTSLHTYSWSKIVFVLWFFIFLVFVTHRSILCGIMSAWGPLFLSFPSFVCFLLLFCAYLPQL